jgi:hypothetical protein
MSSWKLSYEEQTYKQPSQSTTKKHNHANDIDIVGRSKSAVRDAYLALEGEASKDKMYDCGTEWYDDSWRGAKRGNWRQTLWSRQRICVPRTLMTPTNDVSLEIQRKMQTANKCFFGLRKHLQSSHFSRQTKFTIHKPWSAQSVDQKGGEPIARIWEEGYRTICGTKNEHGVYRRRFKHELEKEFNRPITLNVTKTSSLRYAGYMIRRIFWILMFLLTLFRITGRV